jgi:hypothetical protein
MCQGETVDYVAILGDGHGSFSHRDLYTHCKDSHGMACMAIPDHNQAPQFLAFFGDYLLVI